MKFLVCLIALTAFVWPTLPPLAAADFYVAPDGDDTHPGTLAKPFATLTRARDAVRQLKRDRALDAPVVIQVAAGRYELTAPFELTAGDSGTPSAPVIYRAAEGARPLFSGGRVITG